MEARTGRPVVFAQHTDRFIVENDKMNSYTALLVDARLVYNCSPALHPHAALPMCRRSDSQVCARLTRPSGSASIHAQFSRFLFRQSVSHVVCNLEAVIGEFMRFAFNRFSFMTERKLKLWKASASASFVQGILVAVLLISLNKTSRTLRCHATPGVRCTYSYDQCDTSNTLFENEAASRSLNNLRSCLVLHPTVQTSFLFCVPLSCCTLNSCAGHLESTAIMNCARVRVLGAGCIQNSPSQEVRIVVSRYMSCPRPAVLPLFDLHLLANLNVQG